MRTYLRNLLDLSCVCFFLPSWDAEYAFLSIGYAFFNSMMIKRLSTIDDSWLNEVQHATHSIVSDIIWTFRIWEMKGTEAQPGEVSQVPEDDASQGRYPRSSQKVAAPDKQLVRFLCDVAVAQLALSDEAVEPSVY